MRQNATSPFFDRTQTAHPIPFHLEFSSTPTCFEEQLSKQLPTSFTLNHFAILNFIIYDLRYALDSGLMQENVSVLARWFVLHKMVKTGFQSSFVYWSLIWACLTGNLGRVERGQITGLQQILKKAGFSNNALRLQLARLERQGTQEDRKHVYTSKLPPNQKIRLVTILHQFRDKAARAKFADIGSPEWNRIFFQSPNNCRYSLFLLLGQFLQVS